MRVASTADSASTSLSVPPALSTSWYAGAGDLGAAAAGLSTWKPKYASCCTWNPRRSVAGAVACGESVGAAAVRYAAVIAPLEGTGRERSMKEPVPRMSRTTGRGGDWSPEQVVGRCRRFGIFSITHESIYRRIHYYPKRGCGGRTCVS